MHATCCARRRSAGLPRHARWIGVAVLLIAYPPPALAQRQITAGVPFRGVSDGFFERIGLSADIRAPGFTANLGGFPLAVPPFGGFQPGAGAVGGFNFGGGKVNGRVGFEFSQGSTRSNVSQAGSLTMMDGVPGIFADVTQSPFVISTEPIVPLRPGVPWKVQLENGVVPRRISSADADVAAPAKTEAKGGPGTTTAGDAVAQQAATQGNRPILSVAEIRRQREAGDDAKNVEALEHMQRGEQAERDDKPGVAKIHYQMALRRATGELKRQLQERITKLTP